VLLGITSCAIEEIEHFSLLVFEMVGIHLKLPLNLELPALEGRVNFIR
jgi:hypothetical protein